MITTFNYYDFMLLQKRYNSRLAFLASYSTKVSATEVPATEVTVAATKEPVAQEDVVFTQDQFQHLLNRVDRLLNTCQIKLKSKPEEGLLSKIKLGLKKKSKKEKEEKCYRFTNYLNLERSSFYYSF